MNVIRIKSYIGDLQYRTETITENGNTFVMIVGILVAGLVVSIIIGMSAVLVLRRRKTKAANEFKMKIKAKEEIIQKARIEGIKRRFVTEKKEKKMHSIMRCNFEIEFGCVLRSHKTRQ